MGDAQASRVARVAVNQLETYNFERECPMCRGRAYRVRRRPIDRLLSLFARRYRYRCASLSCGWEGALRISSRDNASRAD